MEYKRAVNIGMDGKARQSKARRKKGISREYKMGWSKKNTMFNKRS
jgi:hypothetical protein